jgi:hypothetical protein
MCVVCCGFVLSVNCLFGDVVSTKHELMELYKVFIYNFNTYSQSLTWTQLGLGINWGQLGSIVFQPAQMLDRAAATDQTRSAVVVLVSVQATGVPLPPSFRFLRGRAE